MLLFLGSSIRCGLTCRPKVRRTIASVCFIGFFSLTVIILTGMFTGMVLAYQGYQVLSTYGSTAMLGPMVGLSLLREMGPVVCALMVTARAGSAITAEIGVMRNNEEIDAIELMGLNPLAYVVVPVIVASLLCVPLLTLIFDVAGIGGGYLVGVGLLKVNAGTYIGQMADYVKADDIVQTLSKGLVFGLIISWVSCYKGYHAERGAEGVSRATTQAVVTCSVLVLVLDYFLTSVMF